MRHVPHLYLPGPWGDSTIGLSPAQQHHLSRVLRRRPGSDVSYTDGEGAMGHGLLAEEAVERGSEVLEARPRPSLTIAVSPLAEKARNRFLVEKLAELGVDQLLWLMTRHTEARPPSEEKARSWAIGALEQSRGAWLMRVGGEVRLADLDPAGFVLTERGNDLLRGVAAFDTMVIGPPGGIDQDELPDGARKVGLGKRVLRAETAAIAAAVLGLERHGRLTSGR